ncbi:TPA: cell division protein FtsK, partial [Staphylococcus aureus]|nr:cell division protein FtsK [Staphylococcus aureus]
MAMNEIALFKGVRIQPYQKYIDFMFASVLAFIFLVYRIYILFIDYKSVNKKLDILTLFAYFKPHLLYLLIGTAIIFVICKLIAQFLIRFKTKDLAEMIETQGFHNR